MKLSTIISLASLGLLAALPVSATPFNGPEHAGKRLYSRQDMNSTGNSSSLISPRMVIISMFSPEAEVWYGIDEFDILAQNITVPGLSPLFPDVHCTSDGQICQLTTGESEINAAATISAFTLSPMFNLTQSYFMVAGIAGVNPEVATLGSVTFAQYAVQVALQYEFDAREIPDNFSTGYVPLGSYSPDQYPQNIYGTEVFEVSAVLRDIAIAYASQATLNDSTTAQEYRARYANFSVYDAGAMPPSVVACDVATSDVYYSGDLLSQAFENTTSLFSNGSAIYCTTAQEDNATLEALLRSSSANLTDFSRIIVMRTASDFDRPPPGESDIDNLFYADQGGFPPSIQNIYLAGIQVVEGIVSAWDELFEEGIEPDNYIGDIFQTLGGTSDFGQPTQFITKKRDVEHQQGNMRMRKRAEAARRAIRKRQHGVVRKSI